jgi:hypothetical protein
MVYNGYYKVMSNIPKMGQLPTPVLRRNDLAELRMIFGPVEGLVICLPV